MTEGELTARIKVLTSQYVPENIVLMNEYAQKHRTLLKKEFGRFMTQYDMYLSALTDLIDCVNYLPKDTWPEHRGLQFVIVAHAQKQLYSAYSLWRDGLYEDSITLMRSAYESFLRVVFVSLNPAYQYNVYSDAGSGPKFNATGLVRDQLNLDWGKYKLMSAFAHSNKFDVLEEMDELSKGRNKIITLRLSYDEKKVGVCVNYLTFLVLAFMEFTNRILGDNHVAQANKKISSHFVEAEGFIEILHALLATNQNSLHWPVVEKDLTDVFRLLAWVEGTSDNDWKAEWRRLRTSHH